MTSSSGIASIRSVRDANEARIAAKKLELDTKAMESRLCAVRLAVLHDQQKLELERSQKHNGHRWKSSRKNRQKPESKIESRNSTDNQNNEKITMASQHQPKRNVRKWDRCDIQNWLTRIGMEEYGAAFEFNNVTGAILLKLEDQDLIYLGVETSSTRDRMLKAIKKLRSGKSIDAKTTENVKFTQKETPDDKSLLIHWSHTTPMRGNRSENALEQQATVNAADAVDALHMSNINGILQWKEHEGDTLSQDKFWSNPADKVTNGELKKGILNEEKEHEAFRAAVSAWRTASRSTNNIENVVRERKEKECLAIVSKQSCWQCYRLGTTESMTHDLELSKGFCSVTCRNLYKNECARYHERIAESE